MFLKKIKTFFIKKTIEKDKVKSFVVDNQCFDVKICILMQSDFMAKENEILQILEANGIKRTAVSVWFFQEKVNKKKEITPLNNCFSWKDIGWNGKIVRTGLEQLCGQKVDILVNYNDVNDVLMQYISHKISSNLRVGFGTERKTNDDLTILSKIENTQLVWGEVIKYLKILKKI